MRLPSCLPWYLHCLLVAACGSGTAKDQDAPAKVAAPAATRPRTLRPVTATHGSTITRVAITADGQAAVSADQHGALRLWPRLDGTREPIVLQGAQPNALSIARDGDGFLIADHDGANGVELIRVASGGEPRGRVMLETEPAITQVELTGAGALVLRVDQSIELHDPAGTSRARLVPDPGTRIRSLVQRAGRVLAIIDEGTTVRGRWVSLEGGRASWGELTPVLPLDPARAIVLSPDHLRVIGARPGGAHTPVLVDLATGKANKRPMCTQPSQQALDAQEQQFNPGDDRDELIPTALGFLDAKTVACTAAAQLVWWSTAGDQITPPRADLVTTAGVEFAFGDHLMIGGLGHQLGLYTPGGPRYLGYGFRELTHVRVAPTGVMIGKGDQQPLLLDSRLHEQARYALPKQNSDWTDLLPLDDRYLLTVATRPMAADSWGNAYQVSVYDAVKHTVHQLLPNRAAGSELQFEPATQLLVSSDGGTGLLLRFDPVTHSFAERIEIQERAIVKHVYLLDPKLADGLVALAVHDDDGGLIVDELHGADVHGGLLAPRASHRMAGQLRAVDRAGRLYVHGVMDKQDIAVYRHGEVISKLVGVADDALRPSDDGSRVAAFGTARISLYAVVPGVATRLWQAAAWGASDIGWTPSGELFARFAGALAKLDPITGDLTDRQCGWAFGISETPFETSANAPIVCDVAP
ncbi:MAG: hypothetical protein IPQ07_07925 [Myxococcales bacterium]|nr:hypothetical protein [Myxococcales bacterium]